MADMGGKQPGRLHIGNSVSLRALELGGTMRKVRVLALENVCTWTAEHNKFRFQFGKVANSNCLFVFIRFIYCATVNGATTSSFYSSFRLLDTSPKTRKRL